MTTDPVSAAKELFAPFRAALYDFDADDALRALGQIAAPDAAFRHCHPFGTLEGPGAFWDASFAPLAAAMPDLERRDYIVMGGETEQGDLWIGCGGDYMGTFAAPFLDIPPTGHAAHLRFHEFYRVTDGRIAEMQAIWDIPALMMQARAWPLAPSLGREWFIPGPASQDGLVPGPHDAAASQATAERIVEMLTAMKRHPSEGGPEVMEMERFWHPRMSWYGPGGIGTGRGIAGFRNWHQIPFLNAMPDRGQYVDEIEYHFFGDGDYAAVTGWPNMIQTLDRPGWLGLPPVGKRITMRSLDFWRLEGERIRENWVMVDLMHMYDQIGVDPLARMREFNKVRAGFDPETGRVAA
ncbi:ester cyclase [Sulfitobacter sp. D35]|uniref:ester cyclase n=1 Tax=Sulfitobacter sp. D35 TaxID=3083252 RepID=UPI00296EE76B|nr:ester cyclase [Sulfitobacter sp. D35]MDW4499321.1 ester cyclase [Sulfitobacter sp. D35]